MLSLSPCLPLFVSPCLPGSLSRLLLISVPACLLVSLASSPLFAQDFDKEVAPILVGRCLECHSGPEPKAKLDLTTRAGMLKGGRGGPALVPGNAAESEIWSRVDGGEMPPKKPLPAEEKALLKRWIEKGAIWQGDPLDLLARTTDRRAGFDWWSLQPVRRPSLPGIKDISWPRNPIDYFILKKLEANGLAPSQEADPATLVRRLTFDLIGLPPTPKEISDFVAACKPTESFPWAYSALVERLLASPHYGERWARPWLDIVRFGESNGFEHDELRPNAWPYRDWVIQALNQDLPYDEFVSLQIAGDVLRPNDPAAIAATGFLVAGGYDSVGQKQQSAAMRAVVRQDELEDMISTMSQGVLGLTVHCARCHDHKFDPIRQVDYYRLSAALAGVHHGERPLPNQKERKAYAVAPSTPEATFLLIRGEPSRKGAEMTPGGVAALGASDFRMQADAPDAERRRCLADWITRPDNPLLARVMVNRLWQYHFGAGLVETPSDFGFNGGKPSHPELLDWLADEFRRSGWSMKHMHRLIVTSATYRQASRFRPDAAKTDASNRLLWRKNPMRLEAESLRDTILAIAGKLNPQMGGPSYQDFQMSIRGATYYYVPVVSDAPDKMRRSIYRTWARSGRNPFLDTLDCPDPSTLTPKRAVTTTPLQALVFLNNDFMLRMADHWANRIKADAGDAIPAQVARAYHLALGRPPTENELNTARRVVANNGLAILCRALLNCNEFLYVD